MKIVKKFVNYAFATIILAFAFSPSASCGKTAKKAVLMPIPINEKTKKSQEQKLPNYTLAPALPTKQEPYYPSHGQARNNILKQAVQGIVDWLKRRTK